MKSKFLVLLALVPALVAGPVRAAAPSFDQWADAFSAQWVRLNPQFATRSQYFSGVEQDALDRQLTLGGAFGQTYGAKAAQERAALARQGLAALQGFPDAPVDSKRTRLHSE